MNKVLKKIFIGLLLSVIVALTLTDSCLESEKTFSLEQKTISSSTVESKVFEKNNEIPCPHTCATHAPDICCAGIISFEEPTLNGGIGSKLRTDFNYNVFFHLVFLGIPTPPPSFIV